MRQTVQPLEADHVTPCKIYATENNRGIPCCAICFVPTAVFLRTELRLFLTSRRSFGMVVFAKRTTKLKGDQIMNRKREAIFMGIGILAGLTLCGPASAAVQQLTATPTTQTFYVDGQQMWFEAYHTTETISSSSGTSARRWTSA